MPSIVEASPARTLRPRAQYYSPKIKLEFHDRIANKPLLPSTHADYADIAYEFDENRFATRSKTRRQNEALSTELPRGWPPILSGPLVWSGPQYDDASFIYHLSEADNAEILGALKHPNCKSP